MLTGVNRLKTTGRHGSQVEDAIPPTSTGAVASSQGARGGGLSNITLWILPGSELVAVPHQFHMMALTVECRMNGGLWSYTPKNPLFSGYIFFSSHLNLEFERGGKENTNCWVLDFFKVVFFFKKTFTMSETSYTLYDQRYRITASSGHFIFSLEASTTQLTAQAPPVNTHARTSLGLLMLFLMLLML